MQYKDIEKKNYEGKNVKILDKTYENGEPECIGCGKNLGWRGKFKSREEKLRYIKSAERYWYSKDWFGSEKQK